MFIAYLFALLSPLVQSLTEMEAILKDPRTSEKMREGSPIIQMLRKKKGYLLVSQDQQMYVKVEYSSRDTIGPKSFELIFHDPITIGNFSNEPLLNGL